MRSSYKRLGNYIALVDKRNVDLKVTTLLGLSISKQFIPSVANTIGTDMKNYKIIRKNQFACSVMQVRRDGKMPVALLRDFDEAIISQAYPVFEVIDISLLLPEYLMMWFTRSEFDRQATFHAVGGVRGSLEWEDFMDFEMPIPSIETQQEIVDEYHTITKRIELNEQLNQKLEETAQTLYKHWFVDFEFPNENGEPYKSSGGVMVYDEVLDGEIPEGWEVKELKNLCINITKGTTPEIMSDEFTEDTYITYLKGESINDSHIFETSKFSFIDKTTQNKLLRSQLKENDICYSIAGSLDKFCKVDKEILPGNTNQAIAIIRVDNEIIPFSYIYGYFIGQLQKEFYNYNVQQAVQANLSLTTIGSLPILIPEFPVIKRISDIMSAWIQRRDLIVYDLRRLEDLKKLLLSKMATVGSEKSLV